MKKTIIYYTNGTYKEVNSGVDLVDEQGIMIKTDGEGSGTWTYIPSIELKEVRIIYGSNEM